MQRQLARFRLASIILVGRVDINEASANQLLIVTVTFGLYSVFGRNNGYYLETGYNPKGDIIRIKKLVLYCVRGETGMPMKRDIIRKGI